ncbi:unnamed protein product [Fasciola hepatica]|uniref:Uncharacterized protein n=1 Tax=Fasciola hepatica TaxID=6192 RepID=A0ABC9HGP4_FASHE
MHKGYCESKTKGFGLEIDHYWNSRNRSNVEKTSGKNSLLYFNLKCYRQYSWKYVIANLSQLLSVENALYKRKNLGLMFAYADCNNSELVAHTYNTCQKRGRMITRLSPFKINLVNLCERKCKRKSTRFMIIHSATKMLCSFSPGARYVDFTARWLIDCCVSSSLSLYSTSF